jgi:rhodanese-related sulfurtransferase
MTRFALPLLALALFCAPAWAGDGKLPETPIDEVEKEVAAGACFLFDANSEATRNEHGVIPGAVLLQSYSEYDLAVLPTDKASDIVFYCGSTRCTASDKAAARAQEAGYTNVSVLREGIKGWKAAGKPTVPATTPKS